MTTATIKLILLVAVLALGGIGIKGWLNKRDEARDNKAIAEQAQRTAEATAAISVSAEAALDESGVLDSAIDTQRVEIVHRYETLRNENATVRAFADSTIPVELRKLASERRLARNRLSGSEASGTGDDGAPRTER